MTVTVSNIIAPKFAENAQTTQYTATSRRTIVDKFTATNNSGSVAILSINHVPNGGSATTTNRVLVTKSIAVGETYPCPEIVGAILDPGDFISTLAGTASAITISASGREIT